MRRSTRRWLIALCIAALIGIIVGPSCYRSIQTDAAIQEPIQKVRSLGGRVEILETGFALGSATPAAYVTLAGTHVQDEDIPALSRLKGFEYVRSLSLADSK